MGSSPISVAKFAQVAQLVEQGTENPRVVGSIPTGGTMHADVAHLVERHLAKVEVASSSLVIRSKRRYSQVVRQGTANPRFPSSNLGGASKKLPFFGTGVFSCQNKF